jgi:flagellar protein FliJ
MTALHTLLHQAEAERDQAMAALRRAEEQAEHVRAQAEQLASYRSEYQQRWANNFSRRSAIEIVHCYQSFMQRLDEALALQRQQSDAAHALAGQQRQALVVAERRVASVRKLIGRRQAELQHKQSRLEQRQNDETAERIRWRATHGESTRH